MYTNWLSEVARALSGQHGSRFRRNFVKVARANLIAKVLPFASAPILTRLFSPEDFGNAAFFAAVLGLLAAVATLRFDWSVPNARSAGGAACLLVLGFSVLALSTLGTAIATFRFGYVLETYTSAPGFSEVARWLAVGVFFIGLAALLRGWYIRCADLSSVSHSRVVESVCDVSVRLAAGSLGLGYTGLVAARLVSSAAAIPPMVLGLAVLLSAIGRVSLRRAHVTLRRYWRESGWSTLVSLVNSASLLAPLFLLSAFYEMHQVGWYSLMVALAVQPLKIFTGAIGQSFWSEAASLARVGDIGRLNRLYLRTTRLLLLASLPVLGICVLGPLFVGTLFGEGWEGAGYVLMMLSPLVLGSLVFSPTIHLIVFSRQYMQFFADAARLLLVLAAISIFSALGLDFMYAVGASAVASLAGHLILFGLHLGEHRRQLVRHGD